MTKPSALPSTRSPRHLDVIERAASIFDTDSIYSQNSEKRTLFTTDERLEMLRMACGHLPTCRGPLRRPAGGLRAGVAPTWK